MNITVCLSRRSGLFWAAVTSYKTVSSYIANAGSDYCLKWVHCLILVSHCYKFLSTIKDKIPLPCGIPLESPEVHFNLIVSVWHLPALCRCVPTPFGCLEWPLQTVEPSAASHCKHTETFSINHFCSWCSLNNSLGSGFWQELNYSVEGNAVIP